MSFTWPLGLYRVAGESMLPTLRPGQLILGLRWFRPRPGHIVVADFAGRLYIKRLASIDGGLATLLGDNPAASTDSRHFGPVDARDLRARLIAKF